MVEVEVAVEVEAAPLFIEQNALKPPTMSAAPPMSASATMAAGREASCRQPSSIRLSTRGTQSRSPQQKLPEGKHHAAGMFPSKPVPASPSKHVTMYLAPAATQ